MTQTVNVPGVGTLNFPDGMSQAEMAAVIRKNYPEIHPRASPAELKARLAKIRADDASPEGRAKADAKWGREAAKDIGRGGRFAAGMGKAVYDTGRGLGELVGLESQQDVAKARKIDNALMSTRSGLAGNVTGYVAEAVPAAIAAPAIGGGTAAAGLAAKTLVGGGAGLAQGYTAPYASTGEHVANSLVGAWLGSILPGAGAVAGKVVRGIATPAAKALMKEGVRLTPGQMLGGAVKTAEDKLTSVPLVGGAIRRAQQRSVDDFSRAAVNRALAPLGKSLPDTVKAGRFALDYAQQVISNQYDRTLGRMSATADSALLQNIAGVWGKYAPKLAGDKAEELKSFIADGVLGKMNQGAPTAGRVIHEIQSDLGQQSSRLMKSELQSNRVLGNAVKDLQGHVKDLLERQNPADLNSAYKDATAAFKNLVRVQRAASLTGVKEGIITPSTLRQAVRATDSTRNKLAYSQGRAPLQDLAERGMETIPSKVADSGTAGRIMADGLLLGGGAALGHLAPLAGVAVAAHTLYSRPALAAMAGLLAPAQTAGNALVSRLATRILANPGNALLARPAMQSMTP